MSKNSPNQYLEIVLQRVEKAANQVGALSACATITTFGLGSLVFTIATSASLSLAVFGLCGMLEAFHVQRATQLKERCDERRVNALGERAATLYPDWNAKVFKEFTYNGFGFKAVGVSQIPVPIAVSNPLCPTCHEAIELQVAQCEFPGRIRITLQCLCGYTCVSDKTIAELKR